MKFIVADPNNKNQVDKISEFCSDKEEQMTIKDFLNQIINNEDKNNNTQEILIASSINDKINNLCMIKETKDNKLVELKIIDQKSGNNEKNRQFINYVTEYCFNSLDAETIIVLSKEHNISLESVGYESLGNYEQYFTYVKDKEKEITSGRTKI